MNVSFEVADVTWPLVAVGEVGASRKLRDSRLRGKASRWQPAIGGTKVLAPGYIGTSMPVTKVTIQLPSVEDTIDTTREDAEAQSPHGSGNSEGAWRC